MLIWVKNGLQIFMLKAEISRARREVNRVKGVSVRARSEGLSASPTEKGEQLTSGARTDKEGWL
jgi:hypothetical protein